LNILDNSTESSEEKLTRVLDFDLVRCWDFDETSEKVEQAEE
jgi:hypothetical protein